MAKILVSDTLSEQGLEVLKNAAGIEFDYKPNLSEDELAAAIGDYEGLVIRSGSKVTAKVLAQAAKLKVVGRAGIGVDNVDVPEASKRGIIVMNTPTGNAITTAEHAISLLMSLARKIPQASASMKAGQWEKTKFGGRELTGKTLGVIGLGNIGRIAADRAQGLRMKVIGFDPVVAPEKAQELGIELVSLDELFTRADAITIHTPLTAQTKGVVNDAAIEKMKKGVLLINAARGGVYDEEAVLRGLESGKIAGAAFDVFMEEPPGLTDLVKHPNVVATPHLGASTTEAQLRVAVEVAEQVVAYLTTGEIINSINVPAVPAEMASLLGPYVDLGRRLGQFVGQVESLSPKSISIEATGLAPELKTAPIVSATLAGLLGFYFEESVNVINAPMLAKERGIEIRNTSSSAKSAYSSQLNLVVEGRDGKSVTVSGTLAADSSARLIDWNGFHMDAQLDGQILVIQNSDRPGVIGQIGTILGEAGVNVSRMQVGLKGAAGEASALWALEGELNAGVLGKIQAAKDVKAAYSVKIG